MQKKDTKVSPKIPPKIRVPHPVNIYKKIKTIKWVYFPLLEFSQQHKKNHMQNIKRIDFFSIFNVCNRSLQIQSKKIRSRKKEENAKEIGFLDCFLKILGIKCDTPWSSYSYFHSNRGRFLDPIKFNGYCSIISTTLNRNRSWFHHSVHNDKTKGIRAEHEI